MIQGWKMLSIAVGVFSLLAIRCQAQSLKCDEVTAISKMAESRSSSSLQQWKTKAGDSYVARLVYSFRRFELNPTTESATRLLSLIPAAKDDWTLWFSLDGFLCEQEQDRQVKILAKLHARMPHDIARAVILVPEKLPDYVLFASDAVQDPHSDYTIQMQAVCKAQHSAFVAAVKSLTLDDEQWFVTKIFNPDNCRAIETPEAD